MDWKDAWKRFWHFIWEEDSLASWLANIVLAFILIKFLVYPGLGLIFGTGYPIVAVVSGSMEHSGNFDTWWQTDCSDGAQGTLYEPYGITYQNFQEYRFRNGFNKGDIMIIWNHDPIEVGDVIVFNGNRGDPIIHRVVKSEQQLYKTKGDNNCGSAAFEEQIKQEQVIGKAVLRIPYLGWVKLGFTQLVNVIW